MTRCLFVIYPYATSQLKKRKGKKLEVVLEIDHMDLDMDVKKWREPTMYWLVTGVYYSMIGLRLHNKLHTVD